MSSPVNAHWHLRLPHQFEFGRNLRNVKNQKGYKYTVYVI